jgi:prophage DNA circulation protein
VANWRDSVKVPASFRGVPFVVERNRLDTGRRPVPHEIPFSEDPNFVEDEGKAGRVFDVEGFVVGEGYLDKRDALLTALETKGPGTLVHPFYGTRTVQVGKVTVDEETDRGGAARFTITFHETLSLPASPTVGAAGASSVLASVSGARSAAVSVFNAANAVISPVRNAVSGALTSISNSLSALSATVSLGPQAAAQLATQLVALKNNAIGLAAAPGDQVTAILGVFDTLKDALDTSQVANGWSVFLGVYNSFDPGSRPPGTTPNNVLAQVNFDATSLLIQRAAVLGAAEAIAAQPFDSADAAVTARDQIISAIDEINDAASDDTYPMFAQLISDLVKTVPGDALPKLLRVTPPGAVPSLVFAHRVYTANPATFASLADAETDLVTRNRIPNPGFIPGGVPLTVLSDG